MAENGLYFGDNLDILRRYIADESVDLIYLDPPFNSNASYNVLFKERDGTESAAQITAFDDFWHWDRQAAATYEELVTRGPAKVSALVRALHDFLGPNDMLAYLTTMAIRLVELRRVLKPTGSIYLHCDPTASHYLKQVMDAVFGGQQFRNEIVWQKIQVSKAQSRHFGRAHDIILFYARGGAWVFNQQYADYDESYTESHYNLVEESTGRRYGTWDLTQAGDGPARRFGQRRIAPPAGKHWIWSQQRISEAMAAGRIAFTSKGLPRLKRYLDEATGRAVRDLWTDILPINAMAKERLPYPTQKPEALLERIIQASSNEGDVVLDPFCGCGTTVAVAERLHRRWIGIDVTHLAITLVKNRLHSAFEQDLSPYRVIGEPQDLEGARALAAENRFQFEIWALGLVGARPAGDARKGADRGIDGNLFFFDDETGKAKRCVLQVKSGTVRASVVRDRKGVMERESIEMAALITLEEPTQPMRTEAAEAGFYHAGGLGLGKPVPRLQILTIEELLAGRKLELPQAHGAATFPRAPRQRKAKRQKAEPSEPNTALGV